MASFGSITWKIRSISCRVLEQSPRLAVEIAASDDSMFQMTVLGLTSPETHGVPCALRSGDACGPFALHDSGRHHGQPLRFLGPRCGSPESCGRLGNSVWNAAGVHAPQGAPALVALRARSVERLMQVHPVRSERQSL